MRSVEQAFGEVMFEAMEFIRLEHDWEFAEHEASRVWVIRTMDLEAWKKELEFCNNNEKGRQALKLSSAKKFIIKLEHVEVTLLVNPLSNGVGKFVVAVAADNCPLLVFEEASVEEEESVTVAVAVPVIWGGVMVAVEVIVATFLFSILKSELNSESKSDSSVLDTRSRI